jgi:hypothetical protein
MSSNFRPRPTSLGGSVGASMAGQMRHCFTVGVYLHVRAAPRWARFQSTVPSPSCTHLVLDHHFQFVAVAQGSKLADEADPRVQLRVRGELLLQTRLKSRPQSRQIEAASRLTSNTLRSHYFISRFPSGDEQLFCHPHALIRIDSALGLSSMMSAKGLMYGRRRGGRTSAART